ncbi:MAG: hypothetical protein AAGJ37_06205 [Pseudomonadota bacterium]
MQDNVLAFSDTDIEFFSDSTPSPLRSLLLRANGSEDNQAKTELLLQAVNRFSDNMDAHIALYKFYFRTGQWRKAEVAAIHALKVSAANGGFDRNYRKLNVKSTDWLAENSAARFYLFTLKALGVIRLRSEKVTAALWPLEKLKELDPYGEIGGLTFYDIAKSIIEED